VEKKKLALVDQDECMEIRGIYRRKTALLELSKYLMNLNNHLLYEKVVNDLAQTEEKISVWWSKMGFKYDFISSSALSIDFETCEINMAVENISVDYNIF
jgi:CXXX repeat modification system protein